MHGSHSIATVIAIAPKVFAISYPGTLCVCVSLKLLLHCNKVYSLQTFPPPSPPRAERFFSDPSELQEKNTRNTVEANCGDEHDGRTHC